MLALVVEFNLRLKLMSNGSKCSDIRFWNYKVMKWPIRNSSLHHFKSKPDSQRGECSEHEKNPNQLLN